MDEELLNRTTLADLVNAQRQFDELRQTYNFVRPHEALGLEVPASRYRPSPRAYDPDPPPIPFNAGDVVRKVDAAGRISYRGKVWRIGKAFVGRQVGLRAEPSIDGVLNVIFANQTIRALDLRSPARDE